MTALPDDLDGDLAPAGPVELGENDGLELAQREIVVVHTDHERPSEKRRPQMCPRVSTLAVPLRCYPLPRSTQSKDRTWTRYDAAGSTGALK